jgi:Domain of unknown function (DUF4833)
MTVGFKGLSRVLGASALALAVGLARPALSAPLVFGPHDFMSLFSISKSENKNEVVYGIHLDGQCSPVGESPVFAFWRMNEKGPAVIEPLLAREERAYGIERQRVISRGADGSSVEVTLKALPSRPIVIDTKPGAGGRCDAWPTIPISGESAYLYNVYVKLGTLRVDYLLLSGWALDRRRVLHEQIAR